MRGHDHRPFKSGQGLACGTTWEPALASWLGSTPVLPTRLSVGFQILAAEQDLGVWRRSGLPGEEEEAAAPGQRVCPGLATEPGPGLGSVGRRPEGFRPRPRATAEAAGHPGAGEARPARAGGRGYDVGECGSLPSTQSQLVSGGWGSGLRFAGKNHLKAGQGGPRVPGRLPRVLSASLFPQDNTEILGFLLGGIAALGAWVSRIPPLSRIVSLGLGPWVTPAGLRASGTILPVPGHWGGEVVSPCAQPCLYICGGGDMCVCVYVCRPEDSWPQAPGILRLTAGELCVHSISCGK